MVYVDRTATPTIKARWSDDGGKTWPENTETILYEPKLSRQLMDKASLQDVWTELEKYSVGHPMTALMSNGDVLVVYYAGMHADQTSIEWIRIRIATDEMASLT